MTELNKFTIITPIIKPKYKNAVCGSYVIKGGRMYFKSGKNIVYIREHFTDSGTTPEKLVENTIRYDRENLPETLEYVEAPCYNYIINDVL